MHAQGMNDDGRSITAEDILEDEDLVLDEDHKAGFRASVAELKSNAEDKSSQVKWYAFYGGLLVVY